MNFLGFQHYQLLNPYTFPTIPKFLVQTKNHSYDYFKFQHALFQFNISHIFQWIQYIESVSNTPLSPHLFSLSWLQKNKQNIKFLDKGKGILVEKFGNTDLLFLKKICMNCNDLPFFFNEYFVMVYGINFLRFHTPTFNFTYSLLNEHKYISLKQEFNDNNRITLKTFLQQCSFEDFLSIFFQIILSLEIGQFHLLFTHYDLHSENIMVEPHPSSFSLHYNNHDYHFDKYMIKIIDFSFSSITTSSNSILSNCYIENLYSHGYFPFFTPGTDMFRILSDIFNTFYLENNSPIKDFCLTIFEKFYHIPSQNIINAIPLLKSNYFNCSVLPIIYSTPLELFLFLEKEHKHNLPFLKKTIQNHSLSHQNEFKNIFSLQSLQKNIPHNPSNSFYSSIKKHQKLPFHLPSITPPIFLVQNLKDIQDFYEKFSFFLDWFSSSNQKPEYHKFFRTLFSLKEFLYFIHHPEFKIKQQDIHKIQTYHNQLTKIL